MKWLIYIPLLLLLPLNSFGQEFFEEMKNMKGRVTKVELRFKGPLRQQPYWKYIYFFNDSGKIKEQANFLKGKLTVDFHYDYDIGNRLAFEREADFVNHKDTADISTYIYVIDQANRIQIEKTESGGHLRSIRDSIFYDEFNSPLKYRKLYLPFVKEGKENVRHYSFDYYENRLLKSSCETSDDGTLKNTEYEYNSHGDAITIKVYQVVTLNADKLTANRLVRYQYKYDKYGNWVKRYTSIDNGKMELEIERKIKYIGAQ